MKQMSRTCLRSDLREHSAAQSIEPLLASLTKQHALACGLQTMRTEQPVAVEGQLGCLPNRALPNCAHLHGLLRRLLARDEEMKGPVKCVGDPVQFVLSKVGLIDLTSLEHLQHLWTDTEPPCERPAFEPEVFPCLLDALTEASVPTHSRSP